MTNPVVRFRDVPRLSRLGVLASLVAVANLAVAGVLFAGATSGTANAGVLVALAVANVVIGVWLLGRVNSELAEVTR